MDVEVKVSEPAKQVTVPFWKNKKMWIALIGVLAILGCGIAFGMSRRNTEATSTEQTTEAESTQLETTIEEETTLEATEGSTEETTEMLSTEESSSEEETTLEETTEEETTEKETKPMTPEESKDAEASEKLENTVIPGSSKYPYLIRANRTACCVTVYGLDAEGNYTVPVRSFICSTGRELRTPVGTYKTQAKYRWRLMIGNSYCQYCTRITGPYLFHSVVFEKMSPDTLFTDTYNQLGQSVSAGCIRLRTIDAKWIYDNCPVGTTVIIYDSSDPGPLGKPGISPIPAGSIYAKWDPTDPDPNNPWHSAKAKLEGVPTEVVEVNYGGTVDELAGVRAIDKVGNDVTASIVLSGRVDVKKLGNQLITYTITDTTGSTASATATFCVVDKELPVITFVGNGIGTEVSDVKAFALSQIHASDNHEIARLEVNLEKMGVGEITEMVGEETEISRTEKSVKDGDKTKHYEEVVYGKPVYELKTETYTATYLAVDPSGNETTLTKTLTITTKALVRYEEERTAEENVWYEEEPSTEAPTTEAPTTEAPTTETPTTEAPKPSESETPQPESNDASADATDES